MFKMQKFDLLLSVYIFCIVASELMGAKTVPLMTVGSFHLNASVGLLLVPIIFTINDIIVEVYGKARARSVMTTGLVAVALVLILSLVATSLPPSSRFASTEPAYDTIFAKSARIAAASLVAFAVAEVLDIWVFSKIRERMGKQALWLRNNASNFAAQFLDTVIFITLAFYALEKPFGANYSFLLGIILPYWLLKCLMSVIETPLVYAGVKWLRRDKLQA